MARRSEDWNVGLAHDLQDQEFAREFPLGAAEEGVLSSWRSEVIRAMGAKEFSAKVWMGSPNVLRAINRRHNPAQCTLNRHLRALKLTRAPLDPVELGFVVPAPTFLGDQAAARRIKPMIARYR